MTPQKLVAQVIRLITVSPENTELLTAQHRAFSRQLPVMYVILVSSTWSVAATHWKFAPVWLSLIAPALLTLVCAIRILYWWKSRRMALTAQTAAQALVRTNRLAFVIAAGFTTWALLLYPYGTDFAKAQVAFYMAITVVGIIQSLMFLRLAALIVAVIVNLAFIAFFASTGEPTLIATACNMVFVSAGLIATVFVNHDTFASMVRARTESNSRQQAQRRLLHMIDDMPVAVMTVDLETFTINYVNETSKQMLRTIGHLLPVNTDDIVGTSIDIFHPDPEHQRRLLADPANLPHRTRLKLGPEVLDLQVSAVDDANGRYIGPMFSWSIVTQQVAAEERIHRLAHQDSLTGLPNRATFLDELKSILVRPDATMGLLYIDLDGFKIINDVRGHLAGDELLRLVATRLRTEHRNIPGMSLGRIGGDEFAVLLRNTTAEATARVAARLIDVLSAPYAFGPGQEMRIGASIGGVLTRDDGDDAEMLFSRADMALYAAKAAGKGIFCMFSPDMEARAQERFQLEAELRAALEQSQDFFVFYQPIVDIATNRITTREALVRWRHPARGWISPAEFIPVSEESGLIDRLGLFVLNRACQEAAGWQDGARVAVNVSAIQLGRGTLCSTTSVALANAGLPADRLEIEITETALLHDEGKVVADLRAIRDMGVRVALDDFGTGFSSLVHVRSFPFDKIKIDGSFVRDAVSRPDCAAVVKVIADLGKSLGITTVAEGVETPEQFARITDAGCTEVQGYLFGRPLPGDRDAAAIDGMHLNFSSPSLSS